MPPIALDAAFHPQAPWPAIPDAVTDAGRKAHVSGTTTEHTEPPKYHSTRALADYTNAGQTAVTAVQQGLHQHYMPSDEDLFVHRAEADVVRSAALYLLHPVNMALNLRSLVTYKCCSEFKKNTVRCDIVYSRRVGNTNTTTPFAVVEFKNRGVVDRNQHPWDQALTSNRTTGALLTQQVFAAAPFNGDIDEVVGQAPTNAAGEITYFEENPLILLKQAASYAITYRTRYVALFDWDTLILVYFNDLSVANKFGGDGVQTTVIRNKGQMRLALLGFLELALVQPAVV
jgi:hypothetical protein